MTAKAEQVCVRALPLITAPSSTTTTIATTNDVRSYGQILTYDPHHSTCFTSPVIPIVDDTLPSSYTFEKVPIDPAHPGGLCYLRLPALQSFYGRTQAYLVVALTPAGYPGSTTQTAHSGHPASESHGGKGSIAISLIKDATEDVLRQCGALWSTEMVKGAITTTGLVPESTSVKDDLHLLSSPKLVKLECEILLTSDLAQPQAALSFVSFNPLAKIGQALKMKRSKDSSSSSSSDEDAPAKRTRAAIKQAESSVKVVHQTAEGLELLVRAKDTLRNVTGKSAYDVDTTKLMCFLSSIIYGRQFSLEELFGIYKGLNPKAEKEWEAWLHGKLHIIIHKAPYPSISTVRAVNKWLQKQLEGWLGVVKEMTDKVGFKFEHLRILHPNVLYDSEDHADKYDRVGGGAFVGMFIDEKNHTAIVSFKGTDPWDVKDVLTDISARQVEYNKYIKGKVHKGFSGGLFAEDIVDVIEDTGEVHMGVPFETIIAKIEALFTSSGTRHQIWVTGHSLGGAYATLFHAALLKHTLHHKNVANWVVRDLVTFGSPRVGDETFVNWYDDLCRSQPKGSSPNDNILPGGYRARHWRYVHDDDIVPRVPPQGPIAKLFLGPYVHSDGGIHLVDKQHSVVKPLAMQTERKGKPGVSSSYNPTKDELDMIEDDHVPTVVDDEERKAGRILKGLLPGFIEDHFLDNYWQALERLDPKLNYPSDFQYEEEKDD